MTPLPEHCCAFGVQTPVHEPAAHAEFTHGLAALHVPVRSHVWTPLPEQRVAPGVQTPVHVPSTHA